LAPWAIYTPPGVYINNTPEGEMYEILWIIKYHNINLLGWRKINLDRDKKSSYNLKFHPKLISKITPHSAFVFSSIPLMLWFHYPLPSHNHFLQFSPWATLYAALLPLVHVFFWPNHQFWQPINLIVIGPSANREMTSLYRYLHLVHSQKSTYFSFLTSSIPPF